MDKLLIPISNDEFNKVINITKSFDFQVTY